MNVDQLWKNYLKTGLEKDFEAFHRQLNSYAYTIAFSVLKNTDDAIEALNIGWIRYLKENKNNDLSDAKFVLGRTIHREADNLRQRRNRLQKREVTVEQDALEQLTSQDARNIVINKEQEALIRQSVGELPEKMRIPTELFYFHGLKQKEIASILERPEGTISWQISEALKRLEPKFRKLGLGAPSIIFGGLTGSGMLLTPPVSAMTAGQIFQQASIGGALGGGAGSLTGTITSKILAVAAGIAVVAVLVTALQRIDNSGSTTHVASGPSGSRMLKKHQESKELDGEAVGKPAVPAIETEPDKNNSTAQKVPSSEIEIYSETHQQQGLKVRNITIDVIDTEGMPLIPDSAKYTYSIWRNNIVERVEEVLSPGDRLQFSVTSMNYTPVTIQLTADGYLDYSGSLHKPGGFKESDENYTVTLRREGLITGTITNTNGSPIQEASILAQPLKRSGISNHVRPYASESFRSEAKTDTGGHFQLNAIPDGVKLSLQVTHPDYAFEYIESSSGSVLEIALESDEKVLSGQVVDIDGYGLESFNVHLGYKNSVHFRRKTDNSGMFKFEGLKSGIYHLVVQPEYIGKGKSRYYSFADRSIRISDDQTFTKVSVGGKVKIAGQILDRETDKPVPGLELRANPWARLATNPYLEEDVVITDLDGRFATSAIATPLNSSGENTDDGESLRYQFILGLENTPEYIFEDSRRGQNHTSVEFSNESEIQNLTIHVMSPSKLSGTVYGKDGKPLDKKIDLSSLFSNTTMVNGGLYTVFGSSGESFSYSYLGKEGYGSGRIEFPESGESLTHDIYLHKTASISGIIFDQEGTPLEGIRVVCRRRSDNTIREITSVHTDSEGKYDFPYLPTGKIEVAVASEALKNIEGTPPEARVANLEEDQAVGKIDFIFGKQTTIFGRVIDEEGKPISGVRVSARGGRGSTSDAKGRFEIDGLSVEESYKVSFIKEGYDYFALDEFSPLDGDQEIVLKKEKPKTTVFAEFEGERIRTFRGMLVTYDGNEIIQRLSFFSNNDQSLNFHFSPEHSYKISMLETRDGRYDFTGRVGFMTLSKGEFDSSKQQELLVPIQIYTPLKAKLVDKESGEPISGVEVRVSKMVQDYEDPFDNYSFDLNETTDEEGEITFESTPFSEYRISLKSDEYKLSERVEVSHREDSPVDIKLLAEKYPEKDYTLTVYFPKDLQSRELSYTITQYWKPFTSGKIRHGEKTPLVDLPHGQYKITVKDPDEGISLLENKGIYVSEYSDPDIVIDASPYQKVRVSCEDFAGVPAQGQTPPAISIHQGNDGFYIRFDHNGEAVTYLPKGDFNVTENLNLSNMGFSMWGGILTVGDQEEVTYCPKEIDLDVIVVYPSSDDEQQGTLNLKLKRDTPENAGGMGMIGNNFEMPKPSRRLEDLPAGIYKFEYTSIDEQWTGATDWLDFQNEEGVTVTIDVTEKETAGGI